MPLPTAFPAYGLRPPRGRAGDPGDGDGRGGRVEPGPDTGPAASNGHGARGPSRLHPVAPHETPDPDAAVMAAVAAGDRDAFARLYDRYAAPAYGLARRVCGDACLAQEVVQDAFLAVWRRPSYRPDRGRVGSYLLGVVHNKAVDAVRHEDALRRRELAHGGTPDAPDAAELVVEAAWLATRRLEVRAAVARLTPVQREAIELAYFEGLTCSEVAARLGIPLGTAKTRLRDGMIRLRGVLQWEGGTT